MAVELTPEQRQAFAEALYAGRKIAAIKQLRELSGLGLKESKGILDALEADLRAAHPERFSTATSRKRSGCIVMLIVLFPFAVLVWFFFRG